MAEKVKSPEIEFGGKRYVRIPIKTHVITKDDAIVDVVKQYAQGQIKAGDILFISEKAVAITQGRAIPVKDIQPSRLAVFLSNHVTKTPAGIGLGIPQTMQMALEECGTLRILLAAGVSFITKKLGRKGDFYRVAGYKASSIDGPTPNTLPPYNSYVVMGPDNPNRVARKISQALGGVFTMVVDLNDLGGKILGKSGKRYSKKILFGMVRDNPLGQSREQTPMGIVREIKGAP